MGGLFSFKDDPARRDAPVKSEHHLSDGIAETNLFQEGSNLVFLHLHVLDRTINPLANVLGSLGSYYNFVRPHWALRFGKTVRTPAMQAGLVRRRLSFRDVFTSQVAFFLFFLMVVVARYARLDLRSVQLGRWRGNGSTTLP